MPEAHDPYAALRYRDYRLLLSGSVLATIGGEILAAVVNWELYERTRDPAVLGFAGLAQFLPVLLLALPAGHAADQFSRKVLLQIAQSTLAVSAVGLAVLSYFEGPIPLVYLCLVFTGCARAFTMASRG